MSVTIFSPCSSSTSIEPVSGISKRSLRQWIGNPRRGYLGKSHSEVLPMSTDPMPIRAIVHSLLSLITTTPSRNDIILPIDQGDGFQSSTNSATSKITYLSYGLKVEKALSNGQHAFRWETVVWSSFNVFFHPYNLLLHRFAKTKYSYRKHTTTAHNNTHNNTHNHSLILSSSPANSLSTTQPAPLAPSLATRATRLLRPRSSNRAKIFVQPIENAVPLLEGDIPLAEHLHTALILGPSTSCRIGQARAQRTTPLVPV